MIKALRKKFVMVSMLAVTILLLLLLGALNLINLAAIDRNSKSTLARISENEGQPNPARMDSERISDRPMGGMPGSPGNRYDAFMASAFFVVRLDEKGDMVYADISRTPSVTEDEAKVLAQEVRKKGDLGGKTGKYRYMIRVFPAENAISVVFLDVSTEMYSFFRVLFFSGVIGLLCWGLMLLFVIMLSDRAIRPIAENMEKQRQFVTNAGHEIKTPLAIIQSNTEALELYTGESKWSKNIKEQTVRLGGLMKNLLMLSRMDEGAVKPHVSDFLLSALLEELIRGFEQPVEGKGIDLETEIQPDIFLRADRGQMEQFISILMDNAVKYTDAGGKIRISLRREERRIIMEFQNTCGSLPSAPPDRLFDRFYRADDARTQKNGGYGIGLSVARSIAEANKGSITAEYIRPNSICFQLRF